MKLGRTAEIVLQSLLLNNSVGFVFVFFGPASTNAEQFHDDSYSVLGVLICRSMIFSVNF